MLEELEYHDYMLLDLRYRMPQYAKTVIQENSGDDSRITFLYSEVFSTLMKSNRYALQFSLVSLASLSSLKYRHIVSVLCSTCDEMDLHIDWTITVTSYSVISNFRNTTIIARLKSKIKELELLNEISFYSN